MPTEAISSSKSNLRYTLSINLYRPGSNKERMGDDGQKLSLATPRRPRGSNCPQPIFSRADVAAETREECYD